MDQLIYHRVNIQKLRGVVDRRVATNATCWTSAECSWRRLEVCDSSRRRYSRRVQTNRPCRTLTQAICVLQSIVGCRVEIDKTVCRHHSGASAYRPI